MPFELDVNDHKHVVDANGTTPLLYVLRNDLELNAPRFGCGLGQCGACTVLVDGKPVRSCLVPVSTISGAKITTLEGLGDRSNPHPLQKAFIDEQALQCGYCTNGMIMSAAALLAHKPSPSDGDIRRALNGHLCRCGTHNRVVRAVQRAAQELR